MKKTKTKGFKQLFAHTKRRMLERYGYELSEEKYRQMCSMIKNADHPKRSAVSHLKKQTLTRQVYKISMDGFEFIVVYNTKAHFICTTLPQGTTNY